MAISQKCLLHWRITVSTSKPHISTNSSDQRQIPDIHSPIRRQEKSWALNGNHSTVILSVQHLCHRVNANVGQTDRHTSIVPHSHHQHHYWPQSALLSIIRYPPRLASNECVIMQQLTQNQAIQKQNYCALSIAVQQQQCSIWRDFRILCQQCD